MLVGLLTLLIQLPGAASLKDKRSRLKPLIARLHREFNVSVAEVGQHEHWSSARLACALVSNDPAHAQAALQNVLDWLEKNWPDIQIVEHHLEIL